MRGRRDGAMILLGMVGTFIAVRLVLHNSPNTDVFVAGYNIHHLFTGLLILTVAVLPLIILRPGGRVADLLSVAVGAGLALTLDEWVYLIATDGSNASYLLPVSLWGGVTMIGVFGAYAGLLVYLARRRGQPPQRSDQG